MEIIGRQIEAGFGVEETRGTAQGTAEAWLKNVNANIVSKSEKIIDNNSHGVLEDSDGSRVVKKWSEGELEGILHVDPIGYVIYNLYGAVSSSLVSGSIYSHVFTIQQGIQHASLSIFVKDGSAQQLVFKNGMVNTLEISASVDDYVRYVASFMAGEETDNTDTPSYSTENDFIGKDITIKIADTEVGLVSATTTKVKDLSISFDQGLLSDHVFGAYGPDDIYNTKMSIEGEFTKNFADEVFKDLFLADTAKYMEITIQGAEDLGSGNYPTITILLNKVQIQDWNRSGENDELVTETIAFKAFYNETDNQQSKVTLKNTTTEYDTAISS